MKQNNTKTRSMKLGTAAVVALLAALVLGLFGAATAIANVVTHEENNGYLDAKLVETWGERPDGNIYPGYTTTRTAIATNVGTEACYVRLRWDKYWADEETLERDDPEKYDANLIALGLDDTTMWQDGGDGWWYYVDELQPGAQTSSLFKDVSFTPEIGEEFNTGEATETMHTEVKDGSMLDSIYLTEAAVLDVELQAVVAHNPVDTAGDGSDGSDGSDGLSSVQPSFIPKTGDPLSPMVMLLFALALAALVACICLFIASRRKKREEDAADATTPQQGMRC